MSGSATLQEPRMRLEGWRVPPSGENVLGDCTLIVATYKRPREIVALLDRLTELPDAPSQVVVVDGSPDSSAGEAALSWARERLRAFELVYVKSPAGLTRQRNVGLDASHGEFVYFLDDDCLPDPGYFRAIRQGFLDDSEGRVLAVCGSIVNHMARPISARWRIRKALGIVPALESGRYYQSGTSVPHSFAAPFTGARRVDFVPGGATAYRRSVFAKHRFSEFFQGYAQGEDLEMSLRVGKEGLLQWCGDAHVRHLSAPGGRPGQFQKGRMEIRNHFFIWRRHSPDARLADRWRFWLDVAYVFTYDLAGIVLRPQRGRKIAHAFGIARGALDCVFSPPRYREPPARREYDFHIRSLTADSGADGSHPSNWFQTQKRQTGEAIGGDR